MYSVAMALRDGLEVNYCRTSIGREAVSAFGNAVVTLLGEDGTDSDYVDAMSNAINAIHPSADLTGGTREGDVDDACWTCTYRFDGGYVRLTGNL